MDAVEYGTSANSVATKIKVQIMIFSLNVHMAPEGNLF